MLIYYLINRPCEMKLVFGEHFFEVARTKPEFIKEWDSLCNDCGANFSFCTAGCCGWIKSSLNYQVLIKMILKTRQPEVFWRIINFYGKKIGPNLFWDLVLPHNSQKNITPILANFWHWMQTNQVLPLDWQGLPNAYYTATLLNEEVIVFR